MSRKLDSPVQTQMPAALFSNPLSGEYHGSKRMEGKQHTGRRRVFVQTESGCVLGMDLDRSDSVHTVKRRLQIALNVPTDESSLTFGDVVLKNDLSAVRNDSPLLLTRNLMHRSSSTPCLSPTGRDLQQRDRSGPIETLGNSDRFARTKQVVKDMVKAIKMGVDPIPVHSGLGGAYYFRNSRGECVSIVKPTDEEPFAPNNPKGFVGKALGQPGLKRSVRVGETGFREVAAFLLDKDHFANVPPTALVKITHSIFNINDGVNGNKTPQKKLVSKIASCQQFIQHDFDASDLFINPKREEERHHLYHLKQKPFCDKLYQNPPPMARNKDGMVLLIDVSPSMHKALPEIEKVCSMLVEKKLIYNKYDEVGAVLFGTEDTENELTTEVGGYKHVVVLQNIKVVDGHLVETLQQLPRGTHEGDFLDAIIVGLDMLIKKYGETYKGKKRLCLITNAQFPTKFPQEGTKEEQVTTIAGHMNKHGMRMESIVVRGKLTGEADKNIMDENDNLLGIFSRKTCAKLVHVESPTSLLGALRTRKISPVTIFRGDLELSPKMKIKVWVYKKTSEEKFPTLKKYSEKAPPTDRFATHEVKVDFEYKSVEDPSKVVPPDQRIKGYRYGPQVIPISSAEWDAVKFKPEKSVKLLGFSDAKNIMRHYYMKDVNIFIPEPGNTRAILAVSALARAMKDMNKVAIMRCVWRQGQGNVVVGVLTPNVSDNDNIPDSFYFNVLPFAEDVREFQFPSFSNFPESWQPSEQQQEAADDLVKMLDLAPPGKEEALLPSLTPNPVLERFYRHLELKSRQPDAVVPPLDETLRTITEPDKELVSQNKSIIDVFHSRFELKENPKLKKSSRRFLRDKPSGSKEGEDHLSISDGPNKVEKIGDTTPVQDFEAMISRRDSPKWVGKAIKDMKNKIHNLVEDSYEGDNYSKALECLIALRKGCILEQEPKEFNDFLCSLCKFCDEKALGSFCGFLASKELTLIPKREAIDSEVTDDEVKSFLVKSEPKLEAMIE